MATKKQPAPLVILRRYFIKSNGSICCHIRSGFNEYTTCLHANGRTSCDCPALVSDCKHVKHLLAVESLRTQTHTQVQSTAQQTQPETIEVVAIDDDGIEVIVDLIQLAPGQLVPAQEKLSDRVYDRVPGTLNGAQHYSASFFASLPSRQQQTYA